MFSHDFVSASCRQTQAALDVTGVFLWANPGTPISGLNPVQVLTVWDVVRPCQGSGFDRLGWVPLGSKRARQGPIWSRMGPYISRILIRDSLVIRRSEPVGACRVLYWVPTGFRRNLVLARWTPTGLDGSLDCPISVQDSCTDPYGTFRRPHGPSGGPSGPDGPPADRRRHRRTPFHRRLPGLGGPQLLLAQPRLLVSSFLDDCILFS